MFGRVAVVGRGRLGGAVAARLAERGLLAAGQVDLVVLVVPDAAISSVASETPAGPWVAHMSGATPLTALEPHRRRFSVHPLQTFTKERGPEQLDGAWAGVSAESPDGLVAANWLAGQLGLHPFTLAEEHRVLYHAGASMASNFLVTLFRSAARLVEQAGAPQEALVPLMQRTIDNRFQLTGPIARGDWETVNAHRRALAAAAPDLLPLYDTLAEATRP